MGSWPDGGRLLKLRDDVVMALLILRQRRLKDYALIHPSRDPGFIAPKTCSYVRDNAFFFAPFQDVLIRLVKPSMIG